MAQVNFNDKQSGDQLTANDVNTLKSAINNNEGLISNGTVSGYYDSSNQLRYNHHIIPESNANFDLGSAEYKVRHLFLSNNSLWVGDENRINVDSKGIISAKTRDKTILPAYIVNLGGTEQGAIDFASVESIEELSLQDLENYAQTLDNSATISKIFPPDDDAAFDSKDYSNQSTLNNVSNRWKKIIIPDDENYEPITLDLEKSDHFHLVIPDSVYANNWDLYVNILGDPNSGYAEFKVLVSSQDIDQQPHSTIFSSPTNPFRIRINNENQNIFAEYKYREYPANVTEQSGCTDIILDCSLVNASFSKDHDIFVLVDTYEPINNDFVAYNTIDGVEYGVIHEGESFSPPLTSSPATSYLSEDSSLQIYYDQDINGNVIFTIEHVGDAVFIDPANWTVTSFQEVSIDGVNKKIITEMSVKMPRQTAGTLYTDYIYLGNPVSTYGGEDI
jgi:hypothetical protein